MHAHRAFLFLCSSSSTSNFAVIMQSRSASTLTSSDDSRTICRWILFETKNKYCFVRNFLFPIRFYRATNNNRCKFIRRRRLHLFGMVSKCGKKVGCVFVRGLVRPCLEYLVAQKTYMQTMKCAKSDTRSILNLILNICWVSNSHRVWRLSPVYSHSHPMVTYEWCVHCDVEMAS